MSKQARHSHCIFSPFFKWLYWNNLLSSASPSKKCFIITWSLRQVNSLNSDTLFSGSSFWRILAIASAHPWLASSLSPLLRSLIFFQLQYNLVMQWSSGRLWNIKTCAHLFVDNWPGLSSFLLKCGTLC